MMFVPMSTMIEPFWKMAARAQIETLALASRRAQAYMELPQTFAHCCGPQDYLTEQVRFWQTAQKQYALGLERTLAASSAAALAPPSTATPFERKRDYMLVSDRPVPPVPAKEALPAREPTTRLRRSA
jgi:hypothetical protein